MKFDTSDIDDDFDSEWDGTTVGDVVDDEATETGSAWTREPAIVLVDRWITEGVAAGMTHTAVMAAIRTTDPELHAEWRAAVMRGETIQEQHQPIRRCKAGRKRKPRAATNTPVAG
jgi:hypothetical protein